MYPLTISFSRALQAGDQPDVVEGGKAGENRCLEGTGFTEGAEFKASLGCLRSFFISPLFCLCSGVRPSARPETTRIRGPSIDPGSSPLVIFFPHRWVDDNVK